MPVEPHDPNTSRRLLSPSASLYAGLAVLAVEVALQRAVLLEWLAPPPLLREALLLVGTGLLVFAVAERLRQARWDLFERIETAFYVSSASAAVIGVALFGLPPDWGSLRLLFCSVFLLALGGTVLILLPATPRKVVLSLWLVFHFTGLFVTFSSVDPPGSTGPFLSKQLWTFVYRPYLSVLYLTNAYHFYSPDPGPPSLLWFAVHYDDGTYQWVRLPNRETSPIGMHYQRVLALPEHTFQASMLPSLDGEGINARRNRGSLIPYRVAYTVKDLKGNPVERAPRTMLIPVVVDMDYQYREPTEVSKKQIASVSKRVLALAPRREGARAVSVKSYRIIHQILTPYELSQGVSPFEKPKHWPFFLGEFNADGKLLTPKDPFLYWYLPIVYVPEAYPEHVARGPHNVPVVSVRQPAPAGNFLLDCLELHAAGSTVLAKED